MAKPNGFHHPACPRSDDRIAALIGLRGGLGYGHYWMIIETILREESMRLEYSDKQVRMMAALFGAEIHSFRILIRELIEDFDLLSEDDGYLASTIVYRKPRKKKEPTAPPIERPATPDAIPLDDAVLMATAISSSVDESDTITVDEPIAEQPALKGSNDTSMSLSLKTSSNETPELPSSDALPIATADQPQPRQYQPHELQYYQELQEYIKLKTPRVAQMQQSLTIDKALEIKASYRQDVLHAMLEEMQRSQTLTKDFSSVPQALKAFTAGREYIKARPRRSWKKPRAVFTRHY